MGEDRGEGGERERERERYKTVAFVEDTESSPGYLFLISPSL